MKPSTEHAKTIPISWRTLWQWLPIIFTATLLLLIFKAIPAKDFFEALEEANYIAFLSALLPFSIAYYTLDTAVLHYTITSFHGKLSLSSVLAIRAVDYLISILNHRVSQGAMILYLTQHLSAKLLNITSTVLFLDFLQKTHLILWAGIGMFFLNEELPLSLVWAPIIVATLWFLLLYSIHGGFSVRGRRIQPPNWKLLRTFHVARYQHYIFIFLFKAPLLLLAVVAHWYAIRSFGFIIPFDRLLATLPIIFLVGALPVNVARIGTTPLAWIFFHGDLIPAPKLLAYSLAAHLTFMISNAIIGLGFLPRAYRELFDTNLAAKTWRFMQTKRYKKNAATNMPSHNELSKDKVSEHST